MKLIYMILTMIITKKMQISLAMIITKKIQIIFIDIGDAIDFFISKIFENEILNTKK